MTHDHRPSPECLPMEDLGSLAELSPGDPRLVHVESCVRCRNLVASLRSFRASPTRADERLGAFLARELNLDQPEPLWRRVFAGSMRPFLWPAAGAAAALCLVLLVASNQDNTAAPEHNVVRDASRQTNAGLALESPTYREDGAAHLSWRKIPEADAYRVILYSPDLDELARFDAQAGTTLLIPARRLMAFASHGSEIMWQVQALSHGAELTSSRPAGLQLP